MVHQSAAVIVVCGARWLGLFELWLRYGLRRGKARHGEAQLEAISPHAGWVRYLSLGPTSDVGQRPPRRRGRTDHVCSLRPFALRRPAREQRDDQENNERSCEENIHDRCEAHVDRRPEQVLGRWVMTCMPPIGSFPANQEVRARS